MIYRTSHRGTYRNINNNLNLLSYRLADLNNQIASEKRINRPSDDPTGAATVLKMRSMLADINQYKKNISFSDNWLKTSNSVLQNIKESIDEIYVKAEQGSTDTYNQSQRNIIASEIDLLFESMVKFSNSKIGNQYIFAGQKNSTGPFSLDMRIWDVIPGCQNSTSWGGKVINYGDQLFNPRGDIAQQSQNFLIEMTSPGGIDSKLYSDPNARSRLILGGAGADFTLNLEAKNNSFNNTEIKTVPGLTPKSTTGIKTPDGAIDFSFPSGPPYNYKVNYVLGEAGIPSSASWDNVNNTVTVTLETDVNGKSIASANDVITEINTSGSPIVASLSAKQPASTGTGIINPETATMNIPTTVSVKDNQITVYLRLDESGKIVADANEVVAVINAHPTAGSMVTASSTKNGLLSPQNSFRALNPSDTYTLAETTVNPPGSQNSLTFSIINGTTAKGSVGNDWGIEYISGSPGSTTASFNNATKTITVHLGTSAVSGDINASAQDVMEAVNNISNVTMVKADLSDGNSGLGNVNTMARKAFSGGYDQAAGFRVSQDGGKTWSPPDSFFANEFQNFESYYNTQLGHASLTTQQPGTANDLVFTANHQGNWGNDITVQYLTKGPNESLEVVVADNNRSICVYLATDAQGNSISTAQDVMKAVNDHSVGSQLVTVGLANYHEGGGGFIQPANLAMKLGIDEPYQFNGKTLITPLGHAQYTTDFPLDGQGKVNPNINFQAINPGPDGNNVSIRYTTSADPSIYSSASVANKNYQNETTVRYEQSANGPVVVVHLASIELPSCPDEAKDYEAAQKWKEEFPLYSCTSSRAVISTAGDITKAILNKNLEDPESALVWASVEDWPDGLNSTAKVGVMETTLLSGGNLKEKASNHGLNLNFLSDGTAMQVGDIFKIPVGFYAGDDLNIDVNVRDGYRTKTNISGSDILGDNGASDNILDTIQRLSYALRRGDTAMIAAELPKLSAGLEKVTTQLTSLGTKLIRNEFVSNMLETDYVNTTTILSNVEDASFDELITSLKSSQLAYEAALGATSIITQISLLDYLR